jgi:uncharacterized membrane protein
MDDTLLALTSLPTLHPALVHFPIAVSAVALLFDAALIIRLRCVLLEWSAAALWVLAAAGAAAAYAAGRAAADDTGALSARAEAVLASHADAALVTVTALGLLAAVRMWLARRDAGAEHVRRDALRGGALLGALVVQGLVAYTADLGGALVYRHGVAVAVQHSEVMAPTATASSGHEPGTRSNLSHLEDGSLLWTPSAKGLSLAVSGRTILQLPGSWEDVQLEMRLDTSGCEGSFALGARVEGHASGGLLRIRSDGAVQLVARQEGEERLLDEAESPLSGNERKIGLSAAGRHWKGFVDGQTVVHGHTQIPGPGRAALLLDGTGTMRLISVRISPVTAEGPPARDTGGASS